MSSKPAAKNESLEEELQADEMDQIMDELQDLEGEITESDSEEPHLKAVETPSAEDKSVEVLDDGFQELEDDGVILSSEDDDEEEEDVLSADDLSDFRGETGAPSMEEALSGLKDEEPQEGSLLEQVMSDSPDESDYEDFEEESEPKVAPVSEKNSDFKPKLEGDAVGSPNSGDSLTMKLKGNMTLNLEFEKDGQSVNVSFEGDTLHVQLEDGTEFKIPVGRDNFKKAA